MKLKKLCSIAVTCALLMTGCSSTSNTDKDNAGSDANASGAYPIKINHAFGETVIESEPENVATIAWGNHDVPLALGVVPVGVSKANYGESDENGLLPWTAEKYKELGVENPVVYDDVDGLDYEAISDSNPDVILAAYSGITQEEYDLLSEIAPVVAYPENAWQTLWRDQITMDATAMGKKAEGEALVKELEDLIKEKTANYSDLEGKTAAFCYFNPADLGSFYVYTPQDPRAAYLTDLGLAFPENIAKLAESENTFAIQMSAENIDILKDVDMIVCYGNDDLIKAMQADSLLGTVDAIKNGAVAAIEDGSVLSASCTPSALSIPATIDEYLEIIGAAASNVK
jgi:iron complex transport system substrate-binding protein